MARKAQFVELEQRQIGGLAESDLAEFRTAYTGRRSLCRPAQRILVAHFRDAVTRTLQQKGRADLLHQIGFIIGSGAVDAEPDADARLLQLADRTAAG